MVEFAYNNKMHSSTKTLPFKANYKQNPRIEIKGRKKGKYKGTEKFMEKMKEIQEEAKAMLGKAQEEMEKYADRKQAEVNDYKVGNLVMLSTKDLKYQIVGKRTEKLTERFVGPYKIKKIISPNAMELELPSTVKIHLVVNVSFLCSCLATSFMSHQYSFSNSLIASFAFFKFSLPSHVSDSTINPFQHTKYLSFPLTCCLFRILSTFYSSFPSIITRAGCFFFWPSTCPIYLCILLTFRKGELPGRFMAKKLFG